MMSRDKLISGKKKTSDKLRYNNYSKEKNKKCILVKFNLLRIDILVSF